MHLSLPRRSAAFTLLEIMLVVVIIALLAGAAIFKMAGAVDTAKITRTRGDIQSISTQLMVYQSTNGQYPSTSQGIKALTVRPQDEPRPRNWIQLFTQVMTDGWGREFNYVQPGVHNPASYDLYSSGPNGIAGDADDLGNWE